MPDLVTQAVQGRMPLRLGLVGLGIAGAGMVPAAVANPGFEIVAAADPNEQLRDRFAKDFGVPVVADIEDLLARDNVDAVYIATPHRLHRLHVELAAQNGKHIIVEKPMALTLADCDAMIAAAEDAGVVLIVGHTHAFDPAVKAMADAIETGQYGAVTMIAMQNYTNFLYRPRRPDELDERRGGGILFNQVPHQVDIIRTLERSAVTSVQAFTSQTDTERPVPGACAALLGFESGASASLVYSGYDRFDSDALCDWVGERGDARGPAHGQTKQRLLALGSSEAQARAEEYGYGGQRFGTEGARKHQPHFGTLIVSCEHADLRPTGDRIEVYGDDGVSMIDLPTPDGTVGRSEVLSELLRAVRDGAPPRHDGRFGRETLAVCLEIQYSSRRNGGFLSSGQPSRMSAS